MAITLFKSGAVEKLFFKPSDQPEAEWQEVTCTSNSIVVEKWADDMADAWIEALRPEPMQFTFTLRGGRKAHIRLLQSFGVLKKPRCTYKTIRRDCAKRNKWE